MGDFGSILVVVGIVVIFILIVFFKQKNNQKKAVLLLEQYKKGGENYLRAMQEDFNNLTQQKKQINTVIKEYNSKREYITKQYDSERSRVSSRYNQLVAQANRAGSAQLMNQYKMESNNETRAITQQKNNELNLLRSSYGDVFSENSKVSKKLSILKKAIKISRK